MRTVIHEIRNHLAVAMAGIEAFLDRKMDPTDARLNRIFHSLSEVDALIDDLPRDRTIEFETRAEPINVCALIGSESVAMEGYALEHGVELVVHGCGSVQVDCQQFFGDPLRIGEVVTNVLTNAIRYTGAGGKVEVDCRRDGQNLCFRVSDQGPGVAQAERSQIFNSGFRGAAVTQAGSGVGLSLVKQFVERHGGTIDSANRATGGATFTVRLPVTRGSCDVCAVDGPKAPDGALLVERGDVADVGSGGLGP